jgi:hypothetical protein
VFAGNESSDSLPNIIFDTDMCMDIDDGMALAIVHALHDRHEAKLVAVTVSLDEKWCAPYVDVLNTFYGHPDVPIGVIRNGPSEKLATERIHAGLGLPRVWHKKPSIKFAQYILDRKHPDGSPVYPRHLTDASQAPEAVSLLRKTLSAQADGSVVMIQVGNSGNFAELLKSQRDAISDLSGLELVRRKVRFLSVMAAEFGKARDGPNGINFYEDVPSAQEVFKHWPGPIVVSGAEIGGTIDFPGLSIERDYSYAANHPLAESYRYYCSTYIQPYVEKAKCPHDHSTLDQTAALYALRPDRNYFSLSKPGKITVLPSGNIRFDEDKNGKHRYLIASAEQKIRAQEAILMLSSQPPINSRH